MKVGFMKRNIVIFALALLTAGMVACDENEIELTVGKVIDFESEALNAHVATSPSTWEFVKEGYGWQDPENALSHSAIFTHDYGYALFGGGLVLSRYNTSDISNHGTYESDLYVYNANSTSAQSGGGAVGSDTFLVAYGNYEPEVDNQLDMRPSITFTDGDHRILSCKVNSTSYFLNIVQNGNPFSPALKEGDQIRICATGYDAEGREGKSVELTLARKGKLIKEWTTWDMKSLGKVRTVKFNILGGNTDEWGMTTPKYFAIDNIVVEK